MPCFTIYLFLMIFNFFISDILRDNMICFLALEFTTSDYDSVLSRNTFVMVISLTICSTRALCVYQYKVLWISNKTL